jgi:hypothetical protein
VREYNMTPSPHLTVCPLLASKKHFILQKSAALILPHIGKEWNFDDKSSDSDNDGVATIAVKGSSSSSSKSLFPNLNKRKHTCLMIKESKRKVKSKSSPPKHVSSDDELYSSDEKDKDEDALLNAMSKNPKTMIKGLLSAVGIRDELLDQQEKLFVQKKENNQELKKLLKLEKEKMRSLTKNLRKTRRLSLISRAQVVFFKIYMMSYKRLIKILKYNLLLFGQAPLNLQTIMKLTQVK